MTVLNERRQAVWDTLRQVARWVWMPARQDGASLQQEAAQGQATVDDGPLVLERSGARFRVIREADALWAAYDSERVRRALRQSAGALAGINVATLKREQREQRGQDSPGRPA
jgi:hypothetical protein